MKARNKLDGRTYAIKKIKLNPHDREAIIDEVKTLARMVHQNVVRYYYSWIESDPLVFLGGNPSIGRENLAQPKKLEWDESEDTSEKWDDDRFITFFNMHLLFLLVLQSQ